MQLIGWISMRGMRMRMSVLMLMRMNYVAVTMLMGMLVRVFVHVALSRFWVVAHL